MPGANPGIKGPNTLLIGIKGPNTLQMSYLAFSRENGNPVTISFYDDELSSQ